MFFLDLAGYLHLYITYIEFMFGICTMQISVCILPEHYTQNTLPDDVSKFLYGLNHVEFCFDFAIWINANIATLFQCLWNIGELISDIISDIVSAEGQSSADRDCVGSVSHNTLHFSAVWQMNVNHLNKDLTKCLFFNNKNKSALKQCPLWIKWTLVNMQHHEVMWHQCTCSTLKIDYTTTLCFYKIIHSTYFAVCSTLVIHSEQSQRPTHSHDSSVLFFTFYSCVFISVMFRL